MMAAASIASTDMGLLLQDDVFADFFNTFLNLPVFGQTPLYISGTGRWYLWPELPSHLATQDPSPAALLAWLEKHRLPHFCKSSLCLHLVLCQKLLGFIRSGEAGEELIDFWLITERLLGLDESDGSQRDLFLSLIHRLRATHLREGSSVVTLCTTIAGSLPKARHIQSISTRRDILSKMQEQALIIIQSYWLPKFFVHCKMGMEEEESCQPLLQEYQERLSGACWQEPPGLSEPLPTMHIKRSQGVSGPYCSQKAKAEIWALVKEGRDTQELKMATFQVKPEKQPGPAGSTEELYLDKDALGSIPQQSEHPANTSSANPPPFGGRGGVTFPGRPQSNAEQDLSDLLPSASLARLPSLKKPVKILDFLPWALRGEACAGRPFREFLQRQNRPMETHLLDLWYDLEEFLPVVLDSNRENSFFLRHLMAENICKTYLEEDNIEKLPLETRTLVSLWDHLICGEFSPWIFRAQKEICKVLCGLYEEFLADDDRTFLQFMAPGMDVPIPEVPGRAAGRGEHFHLSQRMNQSLKLSQALHGTRSLEGVSSKLWQLLAARDLQKGGSIQAEMELLLGSAECQRMMADELAVGSPSKEEELLQLMSAALSESRMGSFEEEDEEDKKDEEEEEEGHQKKNKQKQEWAWDAIRELVRSFCKFQREMENHKRRAEFEEFLRQERRNERENLPVKEKKKKSAVKGSHKGKARPEKVALIKRRILDKQLITVNFLVDDLRFYLEMDKFSRLADCKEAVAPLNVQSEKRVAFLKKKHDMISRLFLNSDIPPKLRVNISEKEKDSICRLSSKKPLAQAIYHNAKVTLFPILMYFWRRFCSWKVMSSYREVRSSETREDRSSGLAKGHKKSRVQKEELKRGRAHKEGKVPASSPPAKTPSKAPKIPDSKKVVAAPSATRYAPGKRPVLTFTLSEGLELLEPRSRKKAEPSEEQKDPDPSEKKRPSVSESAPQDGQVVPEVLTSSKPHSTGWGSP
ncbi:PREDICTED: regulator of G-protein signaling protein-like [Sturnus vulgaris]|uniref:regulator of G-protein signaling protein-like n=1 Tax=Sturnus vulgaris TaxID=9172 RepID=UPI00071A5386|nr:PREDICTED: regulator of G-protein signaling protein-like [Sturnus vulgaris]